MLTRLRLQQEGRPDLILVYSDRLRHGIKQKCAWKCAIPLPRNNCPKLYVHMFHHHFVRELPVVSESTAS